MSAHALPVNRWAFGCGSVRSTFHPGDPHNSVGCAHERTAPFRARIRIFCSPLLLRKVPHRGILRAKDGMTYDLRRLHPLSADVRSKPGCRGNGVLRVPGNRPCGKNHAAQMGGAGACGLRRQRRRFLRRLHTGLPVLPEPGNQRSPRRDSHRWGGTSCHDGGTAPAGRGKH